MAPVRRAGSLTGITGSSDGSTSVAVPSAAVVGDIAIITTDGGSGSALAGWTKIFRAGTYVNLSLFWKVIAAGDPGSTVKITGFGNSGFTNPVSIEVWSGATSPVATFTRAAGVWPSVSAASGSIPLYVGVGYDDSATNPPSSITPPSGLAGVYGRNGGLSYGLGVWFGSPTTGTTAPGQTFGFTASQAQLGTIILPPAVTNNAYIAGSTSASDVLCSIVLAGSTAAADTTLLWTP